MEQVEMVSLRIRELREIFDYDTAYVAEKTGIPVGQYEQYEKSGEDIPISVLYKLASIYKVEMSELLSGNSPKLNSVSLVRKGEGLLINRYEGYKYENIGYKFIKRTMEPMIVTVNPNGEKPASVTHGGHEINYCLEGQMILYYDDNEIILNPGDCVYFDPTHPHGQGAAGGIPVKFLTVINEFMNN